jgi:hypothetical protein
MKVDDQFQFPDALYLGKEPPVLLSSRNCMEEREEKKNLALVWD